MVSAVDAFHARRSIGTGPRSKRRRSQRYTADRRCGGNGYCQCIAPELVCGVNFFHHLYPSGYFYYSNEG